MDSFGRITTPFRRRRQKETGGLQRALNLQLINNKPYNMSKQNYRNHVRYYIPHHLVFYPIILFMLVFCIRTWWKGEPHDSQWLMMAGLCFMLGFLSFMVRQHYGLGNQNRIVRLEMRLRYYQLTGERLEPLEEHLGFGRIAALRFASDTELPALLQRALKEDLSADAIKRAVTDWQADEMRR